MVINYLFIESGSTSILLESYRDKTELVWEFDEGLTIHVYKYKEEVRVDLVKKRKFNETPMVISLIYWQYMTLHHVSSMVLKSIRKGLEFSYDLGRMVKISHEAFKGKWSISIREYYVDDAGDVKPGKYGVCIPPDIFRRMARNDLKEICKLLSSY